MVRFGSIARAWRVELTATSAMPRRRMNRRQGEHSWQMRELFNHHLDPLLLRGLRSAGYVQVYMNPLTAGRRNPGGENVFGHNASSFSRGVFRGPERHSPRLPAKRAREPVRR